MRNPPERIEILDRLIFAWTLGGKHSLPDPLASVVGGLFFLGFLSACQVSTLDAPSPTAETINEMESTTSIVPEATASLAMTDFPSPPPTLTPVPTKPPTLTPHPSRTPTPTPEPTFTASAVPTSIPIVGCLQRIFSGDLFTIVTRNFGLSRDFVPTDLVDLSEYLPLDVTLGYETQVRDILLDPLLQMTMEMKAEGLKPTIISGYRSYPAQAIAWTKWQEEEPERAAIISSPPGFSEHQLGTTIDFGSPELGTIVGEEGIQFHTYFYKTQEGMWLSDNARRFGFTLSYPRDTLDETGFYFEPWHYRYIGIELATQLHEEGKYLIEFLLEQTPEPCLP